MSLDFFGFADSFGMDLSDPLLLGFIIIYGIVLLFAVLAAVVTYVLHSVGMYTIAKRRGIHHPGLAWVPVANAWILGSISDQYQYVVKGRIRSRRKVLLGLMIAANVLFLAFLAVFTASVVTAVSLQGGAARFVTVAPWIGSIGVYLAAWIVAMIATVFMYIAYYDLFRSCIPDNAVLFLVLSIFFNFLPPFFVFASRKQDGGMPPRRAQTSAEAVFAIPEE